MVRSYIFNQDNSNVLEIKTSNQILKLSVFNRNIRFKIRHIDISIHSVIAIYGGLYRG